MIDVMRMQLIYKVGFTLNHLFAMNKSTPEKLKYGHCFKINHV